MATNASLSPKGIAAALLGVVIVGALGATPFYLRYLVSPEQQLEQNVDGPIQTVRRAILNLDENLAAISDLHASLGDQAKIGPAAIKAFQSQEPAALEKELRLSQLNKSTQLLRKAEARDEQRGTKIERGPRLKSGRPDLAAAVAAMRNKYLTAHKTLLQRAQKAINQLRSAAVGSVTATNSLEANRIQAIFHFAAGQLQANRAELEYWQAAQIRHQAEILAAAAAELRSEDKRLNSKRPTAVLEALQKRIDDTQEQINRRTGIIAQLSSFIQAQEARIAELQKTAAQARRKLAAIEASGRPIHGEDSEYLKLADAARDAEAQAQALQNGTLADATLKIDELGDMLSAPYEGGKPRAGVRDLKPRLEQIKDQLALLEKSKADLLEQKGYYDGLASALDARAEALANSAEAQWTKISAKLSEADGHATKAEKASTAALQAFTKAARFAKSAASAAARRVREARSAGGDAKAPDAQRLKMITNDGDTEASMLCQAAEIAYQIALTRAAQIEALQTKNRTERFIAAMLDREVPEPIDDKSDELRTEAINSLAAAETAYESVAKLLERSRAKFDRRSVQGKDYVWQVQVGQAAVHLLEAALLTDPEEAYAQKAAAYDLLATAAEGREQSPLLAPAIDTLVYLQKTAR